MNQQSKHITLSELQSKIKIGLNSIFPFPIWVCAEISELKVNYSGHCYMELVEKGGRNQVPKAKVSAVIWRSSYMAISSYFLSSTGIELGVGIKVLLKVSVSYHELYGLSLSVNDIDPLYTLGDMEQQRQQTIEQLKKDGVYDMNSSLDIPAVVQRIAIISSRNAAGYQDFMTEITSSPFQFEITLFDSFMQGDGAEKSIIDALEKVAEQEDKFDVIVMIRGGGSQSDLACFDSYRLCSHVAQMPLPIITGIGHDKDISVADLVATLSLKTPTAVATHLVDLLSATYNIIEDYDRALRQAVKDIIQQQKQRISNNTHQLNSSCSELTRKVEVRLIQLLSEIQRKSEMAIMNRQNRLELTSNQLANFVNTSITKEKTKLQNYESLINSRRPESILSLGFAIVSQNGKALKESQGIEIGSDISITLHSGKVDAKVIKITK